jgi:hypothetical protein
MHSFVRVGMLFLETLFFVGWAGSIVVVVISGIEDMQTIFQKDRNEPATAISGDQEMR